MTGTQHITSDAESLPSGSETDQKERALEEFFRALGSTLVAFSGGTDSAYVAYLAHRVLGEKMLAVTADSPSAPRKQLQAASAFAYAHNIPHRVIATEEMSREEYASNPPNRCYFCKHELHTRLSGLKELLGYANICDGTNLDDAGDYRPGAQAAKELGVRSPLLECRVTKAEVRALSRRAKLSTWDVPASACLSSRIPYGQPVTREKLAAIEHGEEILRELGFRIRRVRHLGSLARIEVGRDEVERALAAPMIETLQRRFLPLGFETVFVDPAGYRMGSLNEALAGLRRS